MTSLRTVQVWGMLTKTGTIGLGILQTAIILRILGPEAYGIVGIVVSLGALVGVSQHVGVVDAAIREIAVADTARRRVTVFWVSLWFRLAVTAPISIGLLLLAPWIGEKIYPLPDIPALVRLMSGILVLYGIQGVLGGAYTGQRAFGLLYVLQLVMALVNVPLFAVLTNVHGVRGFFEAVILAAIGFCALLVTFLRRALGGSLAHPRREEIHGVFMDILHTGGWTYVARVFSVAWQRVPVLLLGRWASLEAVGLFNAALTFGSKLQLLAAALGEVNLAFLSNAFARSQIAFRRLAARTLGDVGAVTLIGALVLILFADVLVPLLAGPQYRAAIPLIPAVTWAYAAFAFLDIASNTLFVPSRTAHLRAAGFGALFLGTLAVMVALRGVPLSAASVGILAGGVVGLGATLVLARRKMGLELLPRTLIIPLVVAGVTTAVPSLPLAVRAVLFLVLTGWVSATAFPFLVARRSRRRSGGGVSLSENEAARGAKDVIVFSGALYDAPLWTNRQQIATRLAERGWKVLYVEPRLLLWRQLFGWRWSQTRRSLGGGWRWLLRQVAPRRVRPNLWVQAQANLIPGSRQVPFIGRLNHVLWNAWHVRLHAWEFGLRDPTLLVYDTEAAEFLDDFPDSRVVYDCVDDHRTQAGVDRHATLVEQEEAAIASRADAIAVTTQPLFDRFSKIHRNVHLAPNAADVTAFQAAPTDEPPDIAAITHPRIGTVGALDAYKLDVPMLTEIARQHAAWQFVFVGPVDYAGVGQSDLQTLRTLPNAHFLGIKSRELVPAYVHGFDVAIIPYRESAYNRSSFPLKFWEFMASGKPIVASGLPALEPYRHLVHLVRTSQECASAIADALAAPDRGRAERIAEAQRHDWKTRVGQIEQLLQP